MAKKIATTADQVAAYFRHNNRPEARNEEFVKVDPIFSLQLRRHSAANPPTRQIYFLHHSFFRIILNFSSTLLQTSISLTTHITCFCAIQHCELPEVNGERETKVITLSGMGFSIKDNSTIHHVDDDRFSAFAASTTFLEQKNSL